MTTSIFASAESGIRVSKQAFEHDTPELRVELLNAQYDLRKTHTAVLILIVGDDRPGCSEVIDRLHEWMDARYMRTEVFPTLSDEQRTRPRFWRYWDDASRLWEPGNRGETTRIAASA